MDWHTIHVYYHDDDKDALILEAVRPLFDKLAGQVGALSWTRHWRQGPHLRLNVRADQDTVHRSVFPAAQRIVGGWLERNPSTRRLDPLEVLADHRRLAEAENERGPLTPWPANNSLRLGHYDRRVEVLGNEAMAGLLADFYADTTPISFRMTERSGRGQRLMLAFDLIVAAVHGLSTVGIKDGFVALRSHAEAFLNGRPENAMLRDGWDRHYRLHSATLAARLAGVVATVDGSPEAVPFVREWVDLLRRYRSRAEDLVARYEFSLPPLDSGANSRLSTASPFHAALVAGSRWARLRDSTAFALSRLLINYTYLQLTRLGVPAGQRFLMCHLAANTVEDQYDVSALELAAL
ncbi:thiopeptide maturation pyridine synthase [Kibdelosporangium persicum]|uniref:Lantibiotic biosynthesis dehydratase C-term n=1 Tax=Kibdelosporangium persicum TaxID=2698649 RepID=A0ABX2F6X6_9PSEU|nr:thiopeptide maturation pyridine synthase [Kibdelosporangium persicum]NRN66540.1 Lantibiotic biosynthesis dehydratase C-term [Kibdelosporangium persicum]